MLDLHMHTVASDGVWSAAQVVEGAARRGVRALAITDHDTVAAIPEARAAAERLGIELIAGVELSATTVQGRSLHVLGYFFQEDDLGLSALIERLATGRQDRNLLIAERLTSLGMPIAIEEVAAIAEGRIGRPHFARVMIARGYVSSLEEAFDRWLGDGRPANIERFTVDPRAAIDTVHRAGGIAVLAHPLAYGRAPEQADRLLRALSEHGADAAEVYCSDQTPGETEMMTALARRHRLLASGGSDFHGPPWPSSPAIPAAVLEPLRARAAEWARKRSES